MQPSVAAVAATLLLAVTASAGAPPSRPSRDASSASPSDSSPDCSSLSDGFYALGCSSEFVGCSGGRALPMTCPAELVYDDRRQQCEYPGNVAACGGEPIPEGSGTTTTTTNEGSGIEGSGTEGSGTEGSGEEGSGEEIEDISGFCLARVDGFYSTSSCGETFVGCSGGVAWRMACPAHLKYDEANQICDYPGNVSGCEEAEEGSGEGSGIEEGSGTEGSGTEGSGSEGSGTEGSGDELITEEIEEKEIDTEDIIVASDADGKIVEEEDEEVKEIEAEDDIIVDNGVTASVEEEEEKVEEVDDVIVEETDERPTESSSTTAVTDGAEAQYDDADDTASSCVGRADGFYARGCSSEMLACSNGIAHIMPCPAGLVFDERNQICDHSAHVAACGARDQLLTDDSLLTGEPLLQPHPEIPRTRDSEVVAATLAPVTPAGPTEAAGAAEYATAAQPTMAGRGMRKNRDARCKSADGLFFLDCSTEFVLCRAGVATKMECAVGEAFDEQSLSCLPLARHSTCFAHAIHEDAAIDDDVQMTKEVDDQADLQKPMDHSFPCDFSGARAESACSDWFRLCEGGRGIEMYCLQGHLFDAETRRCVPAGQLAECQAH